MDRVGFEPTTSLSQLYVLQFFFPSKDSAIMEEEKLHCSNPTRSTLFLSAFSLPSL
jgi:hypothetical protein